MFLWHEWYKNTPCDKSASLKTLRNNEVARTPFCTKYRTIYLKGKKKKSCDEMWGWPWATVEKTPLWQAPALIPHYLREDFRPHVQGLEATHVSDGWRDGEGAHTASAQVGGAWVLVSPLMNWQRWLVSPCCSFPISQMRLSDQIYEVPDTSEKFPNSVYPLSSSRPRTSNK